MFQHNYFPTYYFPNSYFPGGGLLTVSGGISGMAILEHQTTIKSWFQTGDRPTQAQFYSFIESALPEWQVDVANQMEAGSSGGFLEVLTTASSTTHTPSTVGMQMWKAATTADAQNALDISVSGASVSFQLGITGAVTRNLNDKASDIYSVRDFGAKGDGSTNDTAAFRAAFNAVQATAMAIYIPGGTYRLEGIVSCSGAVAVYGAGVGITQLYWTASASSEGFHCEGRNNFDHHLFRDMSLITGKTSAAGTAITLNYRAQVTVSGSSAGQDRFIFDRSSPRFTVDTVFFTGVSGGQFTSGWGTGIDAIAAIKGNVSNCSFTGWIQGSVAGNGSSYPGSSYGVRIRGAGNTYENGHPVEFLVNDCSFYHYTNGISFEQIEGGFVDNVNMVGVGFGALYFGPASGVVANPSPQFNVQNSHFNCFNVGVWGRDSAENLITGNTFYSPPDTLTNTIGVYIQGLNVTADDSNISGNTFAMVVQNPIGVIVEKAERVVVDNNRFEFITTGISLDANTRNCIIGDLNTFQAGAFTAKYINAGVNNIVAVETSLAIAGHAGWNNGLQTRWGQVVAGVSAGNSTTAFTTPFPVTAHTIVLTNGDNSVGKDWLFSVGSLNTVGFTWTAVHGSSGDPANSTVRVNYIAYGR